MITEFKKTTEEYKVNNNTLPKAKAMANLTAEFLDVMFKVESNDHSKSEVNVLLTTLIPKMETLISDYKDTLRKKALENGQAYREASSSQERMMNKQEAIAVLGSATVQKILKKISVKGKFVFGKRNKK